LIYIIHSVEQTSKQTIELIKDIQKLIFEYKHLIREYYSQDLFYNLFQHPYTKIEFVQRDLGVSRIIAANYLNKLAKDRILTKQKRGTGNYYINEKLYSILTKKIL
tara:strand:- start:11368 stop:11685 length:318 start_codon:yes stop_codon:yes gene_type:complete